MSSEKAKRLEPTLETKRQLFLLSGNLCAFPGCSRVIMDVDGNFVGEICHIEAAEKGGERCNKAQTNEERRNVENLMLMCHEHHVVTNDEDAFPIERLKEIKRAHEKKAFEFIQGMSLRVYDVTKRSSFKEPKTLLRFVPNLDDYQITETLPDVLKLLKQLKSVPSPARQILAMAVDRGKERDGKFVVSYDDLVAASNISEVEVAKLWRILEHNNLVFDVSDWDGENMFRIKYTSPDWPDFWQDLQKFAHAGKATLEELLVDLNFGLLD